MPHLLKRGRTYLKVVLDPDQTFYPGGLITGRVISVQDSDSSQEDVTVRLSVHGRLETKDESRRKKILTLDQHEVPLVNNLSHKISLGLPVQTSQRGKNVRLEWRFVFNIPEHVDRKIMPLDITYGPKGPFIHWEAPRILLPASFRFSCFHKFDNTKHSALIEYWVQAYLTPTGDLVEPTETAKHEFQMKHFYQGPRVSDGQVIREWVRNTVSSWRLLPQMRQAGLSLSHVWKDLWHHPEVPKLMFALEVETPKAVHLDRLEPLQILIRATVLRAQSHDSLRNIPQTLKLLEMSMLIRSRTMTKLEPVNKNGGGHVWMLDRKEVGRPQDITVGIDGPHARPWFEVRRWLEFRLPQETDWEKYSNPLIHDFVTYTIKHRHFLIYRLKCEIAGKKMTITGESPLVILRPGGHSLA